jgi:hypothetical protein
MFPFFYWNKTLNAGVKMLFRYWNQCIQRQKFCFDIKTKHNFRISFRYRNQTEFQHDNSSWSCIRWVWWASWFTYKTSHHETTHHKMTMVSTKVLFFTFDEIDNSISQNSDFESRLEFRFRYRNFDFDTGISISISTSEFRF